MKILYSVTVKIENEVHDDWLEWMRNVHIPDVMETKMFESNRMCKILNQDESEGVSYSIQYVCKDMKTLHQYSAKFAVQLQKEHADRYKNKYVAFRTLLEILD